MYYLPKNTIVFSLEWRVTLRRQVGQDNTLKYPIEKAPPPQIASEEDPLDNTTFAFQEKIFHILGELDDQDKSNLNKSGRGASKYVHWEYFSDKDNQNIYPFIQSIDRKLGSLSKTLNKKINVALDTPEEKKYLERLQKLEEARQKYFFEKLIFQCFINTDICQQPEGKIIIPTNKLTSQTKRKVRDKISKATKYFTKSSDQANKNNYIWEKLCEYFQNKGISIENETGERCQYSDFLSDRSTQNERGFLQAKTDQQTIIKSSKYSNEEKILLAIYTGNKDKVFRKSGRNYYNDNDTDYTSYVLGRESCCSGDTVLANEVIGIPTRRGQLNLITKATLLPSDEIIEDFG